MVQGILAAVGLLGSLGLLFGIGLVIAGRFLRVEEDPRIAQVTESLPGANCGACGFSGCSGFARALIAGGAPVEGCRAGGDSTVQKLAAILGRSVGHTARRIARVLCGGDCHSAVQRARYDGVMDCRAADLVAGGPKGCPDGCLGLGSCVEACPFGALAIGPDGLPVVDEQRCTGCGLCELVCPRGVIQVMDAGASYVRCLSTLPGKQVRQVCRSGCIGCLICQRACDREAITVLDNLASIDPARCDGCGKCAEKCPTHCIVITPAPARVEPVRVGSGPA
ncbi:RnfABCDGE type electron transport complex subunit B [Carboxydochorda subterranea]|uniref:Ion-translocating oxidoreductase complex subunit B n=1 Tax=Carboxydichorda subterranea TaxID=3109565 RepID=A0ABZ1BZW5_9FIRM|nr:RnfABCDGE type electron transport complex subunit B [Limnochorda sp. L945t]WRP18125.1 RnfABCDGE type electron transport complex subunit B [Limnochorda sp. L945t]